MLRTALPLRGGRAQEEMLSQQQHVVASRA